MEVVYGALLDYEGMPDWYSMVEATRVLERDSEGRGLEVEFIVDLRVRRVRYVNRYTYAPSRIGVSLAEGDMKAIDAEYTFKALGDGRSRVTQELAIDPGRFVPGPIKNIVASQMTTMSMRDLKKRAEYLTRA